MTDTKTDTNTSLSTFRRCPHEYLLAYEQQLSVAEEDREPLLVGQSWHKAFEADALAGDSSAAYRAIQATAPSPAWVEKLSRLYAAHGWYWNEQPLIVLKPESTFRLTLNGREYEGQIDSEVQLELEDGRRGILERKTAGEDIGATADYWNRLRLDVQTGLYSLAASFIPDFILYDVTRKPTILPKKLTKADVARFKAELARDGQAKYYMEPFGPEVLEPAIEEGRESIELYGARLTADIGDRPEFYFQRRAVDRTANDYQALARDLEATARQIETAREHGFAHNPDSCASFGRCKFFGLCSNHVSPDPAGDPPVGFRRREHRHPELVQP